jgi:hypothetical protein
MTKQPVPSDPKPGSRLKDFFQVGEVLGYFFRKKDPNPPAGFSLKAMHTINKIAILMFLVCLLVILKRYLFGY